MGSAIRVSNRTSLSIMDYVPPRWTRRLIIAPVVFVAALILTVASPAIHLVAAVLDLLFDRKRWRISRLAGIGLAFCVAEVFGLFALFTVWVGSGFGLFMHRPFWTRANNLLAGQYMELVTNAIVFFIGFEFSLTFEDSPVGAQLLFARHVGPGDALRLMKIVFRDMGRRCHAVGAAKLQWDPFLDIAGERLGFHYLLQLPVPVAADAARPHRSGPRVDRVIGRASRRSGGPVAVAGRAVEKGGRLDRRDIARPSPRITKLGLSQARLEGSWPPTSRI